jgi:DNA-binding protein YbaB
MDKLIQALQIFLKYGNPDCPTHCEHDALYVMIDPKIVSDEDKKLLEELGFREGDLAGTFKSYRYGSA